MNCLDTAEVWNEDGDVLYCSRERFTRGQAKKFYAHETGEWFPQIRAVVVHMRLERRENYTDWEGDNPWPYPSDYDEFYVECPKEQADFECWRVEYVPRTKKGVADGA